MAKLGLHVFDVGHGDSIVLEFPNGKWGVVDTHTKAGENETPALSFLKERNVKELSFVCLTHPHYDHYFGMYGLLNYFTTGDRKTIQFWDFGFDTEKIESYTKNDKEASELTEIYRLVLRKATRARKNKLKYIRIDEKTRGWDMGDNVIIKPLAPSSNDVLRFNAYPSLSPNLLSVVLAIVYSNSRILLCGDAVSESWENILKEWNKSLNKSSSKVTDSQKFHTIKVSHHGSSEGHNTEIWKDYTIKDHSVALISVGHRFEKLPNVEVLKDIYSNKVKIYCTNLPIEVSAKLALLSRTLRVALNLASKPLTPRNADSPYHGNCSIFLNQKGSMRVSTQFNKPYIS